MAIELVNIGRIANDGTGDDLREAFSKINRSLEELDLRIDDKTEGANVGGGTGEIFRRRDGYDLEFKTINGSNGLTITNNETTLTLNLDTSIANLNLAGDQGAYIHPQGELLTIRGGTGITTTARDQDNSITIDVDTFLADDPSPALGTTLNANNNDIINVDLMTANNIVSLVHGIDIRDIGGLFSEFNFGTLSTVPNTTNFLDYLLTNIDVDMGTVTAPDSSNLDFGTLV
jgi:hypothetical protein